MDRKVEVQGEQELQLQLVELAQREPADFRPAGGRVNGVAHREIEIEEVDAKVYAA
jgi:hypothetical protein